jgi:predicted GH43/DUF377 family glycosyl hydrolase
VTTTASIELRHTTHRLRPDPGRVIAKLFVPGHENVVDLESRAGTVVERVLGLTDDVVAGVLADVVASFAGRHADLAATLDEHFELVAHRIEHPGRLSTARRQLVGAYFTQEYAVEGAAICNPSMVLHPDQRDVGDGEARFVMSLRAIGDGHNSCIEFRTGVVAADGDVRFDEPAPHLVTGRQSPSRYDRDLFHGMLRALEDDGLSTSFVLDRLPQRFTDADLELALSALHDQLVTRRGATDTIDRIRWIAASNYQVTFPAGSALSARVLIPVAPTESHGMEDARFVRFSHDDGTCTYYAPYTAYDGRDVGSRLLSTTDFCTFEATQLRGQGAQNKGLAFFPRRIGGRYTALSRWDRETNAIVTSSDPNLWDDPVCLQRPTEPWELVQLGNCGSPLETASGWIVLTHGVGPMRRYAVGVELLDLDDPSHVLGHLAQPLFAPTEDERNGYVPNVVYSCGGMIHGDNIVIPYGMADANVGVAVASVDEVLDRLA